MIVQVEPYDRRKVEELISQEGEDRFSKAEQQALSHCLRRSDAIWAGFVDDEFVCTWGFITPTLISEQAYLWLHVTDKIVGHEFLFVRHSQMWIQQMLIDYPIIKGHTQVENRRAVRWLRWLGATFHEEEDGVMAFTIRKGH